jgi:hypothetical protein
LLINNENGVEERKRRKGRGKGKMKTNKVEEEK